MNQIDLHIHSIYSNDGTFTPEELLRQCAAAGIQTMAVADHNTTLDRVLALQLSWRCGVQVIPAVELDCTYRGTDLHVLGYGIDVTDPRFHKVEQELAEQERASSEPRMRLLQGLGLAFDEKAAAGLAHYGYITGEVIAEVALQDPRNDGLALLEPYRRGGARSDNPYVNFYWDYCAPGKPAYVPISFISLKEAVQLIVSSGGVAVLAHPARNVPREREDLLLEILQQGFAGVEAISSYHTPEQRAYYERLAEDRGLLVTAGSDYHGKTKPAIQLGKMDLHYGGLPLLQRLREQCGAAWLQVRG